MYEGSITKDDLYTILPFPNVFYVITATGEEIADAVAAGNAAARAVLSEPYLASGQVPPHDRFPDFDGPHWLTGSYLPHYVLSQTPSSLDAATTYDLVVSDYDATFFAAQMQLPSTVYPTDLTSETALRAYIVDHMICGDLIVAGAAGLENLSVTGLAVVDVLLVMVPIALLTSAAVIVMGQRRLLRHLRSAKLRRR
eukprot:gnl/Ergobibamus_cyprinoides/1823.p1 GENE.gnl/Ergobibamus_cyprinoides/1823~~gnl/Ergobibamus_cyprinoides/1823.p1  ORF type:complete len:197 (+),score=61.24 gnl/Ergobibamus_cyprinoides/1823:351-941(+)